MLAPRCDLLTPPDCRSLQLSVKQGSVICITQSYHWPNEPYGIIWHYSWRIFLSLINTPYLRLACNAGCKWRTPRQVGTGLSWSRYSYNLMGKVISEPSFKPTLYYLDQLENSIIDNVSIMSESWLFPCILLKSCEIWPQLWQKRPSDPKTHIVYIWSLLSNQGGCFCFFLLVVELREIWNMSLLRGDGSWDH